MSGFARSGALVVLVLSAVLLPLQGSRATRSVGQPDLSQSSRDRGQQCGLQHGAHKQRG